MSQFKKALKYLRQVAMRLQRDQDHIARRNARRKVLEAMKRVRLALNEEFPQIAKPKRKPAPRPEKPAKLKLPYLKRFKIKEANLFVEVVSAYCGGQLLPKVFFSKRWNGGPFAHSGYHAIYVNADHTATNNWLTLIHTLAICLGASGGKLLRQREEELLQLWARFWSELIPHDDLEVVARHQAFLETLK